MARGKRVQVAGGLLLLIIECYVMIEESLTFIHSSPLSSLQTKFPSILSTYHLPVSL